MCINSIQNHLPYQQPGEINFEQEQQKQSAVDKNAGTAADQIPRDEYISSEKAPEKPGGLYRVVADENGNPKVLFDDPKKVKEKCTTNTEKADREIEKLKGERKQLERQIKSAAGDDEKVRELEKKLAALEMELKQKDNDTYRRQNASVS